MLKPVVRIPISNSSRHRRVLILEPGADPVVLGPKETVELIYMPEDGETWDFEIEVHEDDSLLLYSRAPVEVWRNGIREL